MELSVCTVCISSCLSNIPVSGNSSRASFAVWSPALGIDRLGIKLLKTFPSEWELLWLENVESFVATRGVP